MLRLCEAPFGDESVLKPTFLPDAGQGVDKMTTTTRYTRLVRLVLVPRAPPPVVPLSCRLLHANIFDAWVLLRLFQLQLQQQQAEGASRQDAARLGAMNSKLTKDFNRVNAIALDLGAQVCVGGASYGL